MVILVAVGALLFPTVCFTKTGEAAIPAQGYFIKENRESKRLNSSIRRKNQSEKKKILPQLGEKVHQHLLLVGSCFFLFYLIVFVKSYLKR